MSGFRFLRIARFNLGFVFVLGLACIARAGNWPDERQILWQRNLDDALAIAKAEDRPILVALNMDGESASERIVRERYRDPEFVKLTRPFVCVMASVFRHTPRDHDDDGRRIPCPRLGEVTCGEHIALEPILYDKWLSDHERVAPRHALILQDGTKGFDLFMLFDLRDLDRHLAESSSAEALRRGAAPLSAHTSISAAEGSRAIEGGNLKEAAGRRSNRERSAFESLLVMMVDEKSLTGALEAIVQGGNKSSIDAFHVLCAKAPMLSGAFRDRIVGAAQHLKIESSVTDILKSRVSALGRYPGSPTPSGEELLLPMLAKLDGASASTRSLLLACCVVGEYGKLAEEALAAAFDAPTLAKIAQVRWGDSSLTRALNVAHEFTEKHLPQIPKPSETMASAEQLEQQLAETERELKTHPDDPQLQARYGKASLDLGRRRIEAKAPGAQLLFEDANVWLSKAADAAQRAGDAANAYTWSIECARANYYLGHFEEEARWGKAALNRVMSKRLSDLMRESTEDALMRNGEPRIAEAIRWVGDANARLLSERSGKDAVREVSGLQEGAAALATVAASQCSDETDWTSFSSFYGALGLWREELAILQEAALRFPASQEIRQSLNRSLWNGGRIDLAPVKADWIASQYPESADCAWYAGYAWMLQAENDRRREEPDRSIEDYGKAQERFEKAIALKPEYADNSKHYIAMSWLGRGFAHLLADRRKEAADCLARAVAVKRDIASARDGLDREPIDLLDQSLEWRESGPSPADPIALLDALEKADPENPFWSNSVSDSEYREALRADGRSPGFATRQFMGPDGTPHTEEARMPSEEGDRYLEAAIEAARRALKHGDTPDNRRPLAQMTTTKAERLLVRNRIDEARACLAEAAPLLGESAPAANADRAALDKLAQTLRAKLGDARPIVRPGR